MTSVSGHFCVFSVVASGKWLAMEQISLVLCGSQWLLAMDRISLVSCCSQWTPTKGKCPLILWFSL